MVIDRFRLEGRTLVWPGETLETTPYVTRRSVHNGAETMITAYQISAENADAVIETETERGTERLEWKVFSFDEPADLLARLAEQGLAVGAQEALVVYDLEDGELEESASVEVVRVETLDRLADFRLVAEEAFGKDYSLTTNQLAEAIREGRRGHDAYIAYVEGVPASVGRLYTHPESQFAGFYGGGTRPAYRGRGLYRAVVAARARDAARLGARYLQVDALPTSLPILLRLGFTHIADTWPCTRD